MIILYGVGFSVDFIQHLRIKQFCGGFIGCNFRALDVKIWGCVSKLIRLCILICVDLEYYLYNLKVENDPASNALLSQIKFNDIIWAKRLIYNFVFFSIKNIVHIRFWCNNAKFMSNFRDCSLKKKLCKLYLRHTSLNLTIPFVLNHTTNTLNLKLGVCDTLITTIDWFWMSDYIWENMFCWCCLYKSSQKYMGFLPLFFCNLSNSILHSLNIQILPWRWTMFELRWMGNW